ncbi:MAG: protein kinase domain-containing protein, partial [Parachlamydiaceae bacterium]
KWQNKSGYFSPLYTETPFSLSICKDRCILDTNRQFLTEGHSSKNFHYSADTRYPRAPLLRITARKNSEEFEREWNIYSYILASYRETGEALEGLMLPWSLLTVGEKKIIYLPIGKPYFFIPLSKEQLAISISLIKGLYTLHSECLAHGDPKLSNFVLIDGKARWLDFGSTVPFGVELNHCYTQGYQAPEYFLTRDRNMALLDIYALGVTLYEIHYGKKPPFIYDPFTLYLPKHAEWCDQSSNIPLVKVIKGFMHPDKDKRMGLKEGLKILEEATAPNPAS